MNPTSSWQLSIRNARRQKILTNTALLKSFIGILLPIHISYTAWHTLRDLGMLNVPFQHSCVHSHLHCAAPQFHAAFSCRLFMALSFLGPTKTVFPASLTGIWPMAATAVKYIVRFTQRVLKTWLALWYLIWHLEGMCCFNL